MSRIINKKNLITQKYKLGVHTGIDIVGKGMTLANIIAHSAGKIVKVVSNCNENTYKSGKKIYGNYVKIKHDSGYYTLYAHLKYGSVKVKLGDKVKKGQVIGYMGNTGYSSGGHLHFEVRSPKDVCIDPTKYIDSDLPKITTVSKKKSVTVIAKEVIAGKWGNGTTRKTKLTKAGYNYSQVQKMVNKLLK